MEDNETKKEDLDKFWREKLGHSDEEEAEIEK